MNWLRSTSMLMLFANICKRHSPTFDKKTQLFFSPPHEQWKIQTLNSHWITAHQISTRKMCCIWITKWDSGDSVKLELVRAGTLAVTASEEFVMFLHLCGARGARSTHTHTHIKKCENYHNFAFSSPWCDMHFHFQTAPSAASLCLHTRPFK